MDVPAQIDSLLAQTAALHKHLCPRQVLGVRMGMLAARRFAFSLPQRDKRLLAFVESDGCFADGVTIATGCSLGHRTMRLMDQGKVAVTFVDSKTAQAFRIWPAPQSRALAATYAPDAPNRWTAQLKGYQTMPDDELLRLGEVELTVDLQAIVGKPGVRASCSQCGEEILNLREVRRDGLPLCLHCAGSGYWKQKPQEAAEEDLASDRSPAPGL